MKLILDTSVNVNYIQTLCMIFFPGAKFAQDEVVTDETPLVTVTTRESEEEIYAYAKIQVGEQAASAEFTQPIRNMDEKRAGKIAVGKAVFKAGESFFGYTPAWGILTGIRPAKIARQLYESLGGSEFHVKKALRNEYFLNPKKAALLNAVTVKIGRAHV